jgi:hypothetical protein
MTIETKSKNDFDALLKFFSSYKDYDYFYEWCDSINDGLMEKDYAHGAIYAYGTKWWDFEFESSEDHLSGQDFSIDVFGDSAWAPPLGLAELLSKAFDCEVRIEFSEPGMNFAGVYTYVNGNPTEEKDYEYNEFQYLEVDRDYAIDQIKEGISDGWYEDVNQLRSGIEYMREEDIDYLVDIFNKVEVKSN